MTQERHQDFFIAAFRELHTEGDEWMYLPDVAQRAASHDEQYLQRRQKINRRLGLVGVQRSELPHGHFYPPRGGLYPLIAHMEADGLVEGEFEDQPSVGEHRRRMYRLLEESEPAESRAARIAFQLAIVLSCVRAGWDLLLTGIPLNGGQNHNRDGGRH